MSCHGGGEHHSHEGARKFFTLLGSTHNRDTQTARVRSPGKHVAVYGKLRGKANATRKEIDVDIVHLWQVENGGINRFEAFIDTPGMLTALGN
jgi:ketosteroid isomerase-like protein